MIAWPLAGSRLKWLESLALGALAAGLFGVATAVVGRRGPE